MTKIHTRLKRKYRISRFHRHKIKERINKPKAFKTEESARIWAEKNKIKDYELINIKGQDSKSKKIKIVKK